MARQLLNLPPIINSITYQGKLSRPWENWFKQVQQTNSQFFITHNLDDTNGAKQVPLPMMPSYSEDDRDLLSSVQNGVIIYNTTSHKFNFRENNAWKELP